MPFALSIREFMPFHPQRGIPEFGNSRFSLTYFTASLRIGFKQFLFIRLPQRRQLTPSLPSHHFTDEKRSRCVGTRAPGRYRESVAVPISRQRPGVRRPSGALEPCLKPRRSVISMSKRGRFMDFPAPDHPMLSLRTPLSGLRQNGGESARSRISLPSWSK